ncbi:MAG: nucleoside triphosphate pyrophosphohydrolase [Candidatus Omnitrophota bacterium]
MSIYKMNGKSFQKLVKLMTRLRSKDGCPWDREQTHSSIKKHLIEEAYEVCDAIDSKNPNRFKDELGDLLFQVIFHAQIAKERGAFDIEDVIRTSYKKMLRRHPHVFGKHKAHGPDEAYKRWQEKKDEENNYEGGKTLLKGIPKTLPALLKAQKVSKRASWAGFDWPDIKGVIKKVDEELKETKKTLKYRNKRRFSEEIGDLLFAIVNLARFQGIDAEEALNRATKKFAKRFRKIEEELERRGKKIRECNLKELDHLWNLHK